MTLPKVSIATCSYNRPDLLRKAVMSLRVQTDPNWEHLIYDEGSTDPKIDDVLAWAAEDRRVRVWRGDANRDRPAAVWNFLLDRAHGRYLATMDDDNEKRPSFVGTMAGHLDRDPDLGFVTCGFIVRTEGRPGEEAVADWEHHYNLRTSPDSVERESTCEGGAVLYRREAFERVGYFSETIRTNEDWEWIRRAVKVCKFKNLPECHAVYRQHTTNRQLRAEALGHSADVELLRSRPFQATLGVRVVRPPVDRLTQSQRDVIGGMERALAQIPWVREVGGTDLALVVAPFQITDDEVREAVAGCRCVLFMHMEDPYALSANMNRVRAVKEALPTWVCTNDASAVRHYREVVGDRVITYSSLSADSYLPQVPPVERDIDVLLCGYAYPSRQRFVWELLPRLAGRRVVLVGDGWSGQAVETCPTLSAQESHAMHARAKTVICLHRVHGDCADGPDEPRTINRGFMEGYLGPRVFLDRTRLDHALDPGDVVWYDDQVDLAAKLHGYLSQSRDPAADRFAEKCRTLYTYRARLARILNCVRGDRHMARIP